MKMTLGSKPFSVPPPVITNIGIPAYHGSGGAVSITLGSTLATGTMIFVAVRDNGNGGSSITDSDGHTYTRGASTSSDSLTSFFHMLTTSFTSGGTINFTPAVGGYGVQISACAITNLKATGSYDSSAANNKVAAWPNSITSGTPAAANELFIGVVASYVGDTDYTQDAAGWGSYPAGVISGVGVSAAGPMICGSVLGVGSGTKNYYPRSANAEANQNAYYAIINGFRQ